MLSPRSYAFLECVPIATATSANDTNVDIIQFLLCLYCYGWLTIVPARFFPSLYQAI